MEKIFIKNMKEVLLTQMAKFISKIGGLKIFFILRKTGFSRQFDGTTFEETYNL